MNPRSSTETRASSSAKNSPFKYTNCSGFSIPFLRCASLREPQSYGIPGAAEKVRRCDVFQCNQREFRHRTALERDFDHADTLRARDRRDQRLLRFEREREIAGFAFGQR